MRLSLEHYQMSGFDDFIDYSFETDTPSHVIRQMSGPLSISSIPKIIMQYGSEKKYHRTSKDSVERTMSEWEYHYLTESDASTIIKENFPNYIDVFEKLSTEKMKSSFFAYAWLYLNGGVYLDANYEILKSLDSLFYNESELYFATNPDVLHQVLPDFLASKPKCKFWLDMMNEVKNSSPPFWAKGSYLQSEKRTGSEVLTSALHKSRNQYIVISPEILNKCGVCASAPSGDGYLRRLDHSMGETYDEKVINFCYCNFRWIFWGFLIILGIIALYYIFRRGSVYYISPSPAVMIPGASFGPAMMPGGQYTPMGSPMQQGNPYSRQIYQPFMY